MRKELFIVFQDCYKCGPNAHWADMQHYYADTLGFKLTKKMFVQPGAKELIQAAAKKGYRLPFITDGTKFGYCVKDFVEKEKPVVKKTTKKKTTKSKRSKKVDESA